MKTNDYHVMAILHHIPIPFECEGHECEGHAKAERFAAAMKPVRDNLLAKQADTLGMRERKEDAYDDIIFKDVELDNAVKNAFDRSKHYDRDNPGELILNKTFPDGKFTTITMISRTNEPDAVDQLATRFANLGESHSLFPLAAELRERAAVSRTSIEAFNTAIRDLKIAEAEEEIAKTEIRRQYENNYFDARRALGKFTADRLFPTVASSHSDETPPADEEEPPAE